MKPIVKQSEKSRILQTKDYSIFNFPDFKVSKKHLNVISESIDEKNLSVDYPILVDDEYNIIEGRYRFLALYNKQLPIHYKVTEVTTLQDAVRIKYIHKNLPIDDVVKVYADLKPYHDIILMHDEFDGFFHFHFIAQQIPEAIRSDMKRVCLLRKILDAGKLPEWDYTLVRNKLNVAKKFHNKYYEKFHLGYWDLREVYRCTRNNVLSNDTERIITYTFRLMDEFRKSKFAKNYQRKQEYQFDYDPTNVFDVMRMVTGFLDNKDLRLVYRIVNSMTDGDKQKLLKKSGII